MKKAIKFLLRVSLLGLLIIISMVGYIVYQLETSIDDVLSQEQQEWMYTSIENTEDLPDTFYTTVERYFPNHFKTSFWEATISSFDQKNRVFCPCHSIYHPYIPGEPLEKIESFFLRASHYSKVVLSLELEERFSQKKCFTYIMNTIPFGNEIYGVKEASLKFYNKDLNQLSEREILELVIIERAPYRYHPIKFRERLDEAVERVINLHKN